LLFDLDFFFDHAAPLMIFLQYFLQSLLIAVILEVFIRRPERKLSADLTSKYIAYADYLLHHCSAPSKTDRWVIECLALMRTDWLPATSDKGVVAATELSCHLSSQQLQLPSYASFWEHQQQLSQNHHRQLQQHRSQQHQQQLFEHHQQQPHQQQQQRHEDPLQQIRKRLKVLPPLRITAAS
jgi:hypothetical protein